MEDSFLYNLLKAGNSSSATLNTEKIWSLFDATGSLIQLSAFNVLIMIW